MRRPINKINDEVFLLKDFAVLCPCEFRKRPNKERTKITTSSLYFSFRSYQKKRPKCINYAQSLALFSLSAVQKKKEKNASLFEPVERQS